MKTALRMLGAALGFLLLASGAGWAQFTQPCSVADGSGARSAGGGLEHVSAGAQPGGISVSRSGTMLNAAGFLGGAILCPDLDRDGDGLADEIDPDNDGDSLWDLDEIAGSAFAPLTATDLNNPDSDDDGSPDGAEAGAQTDPLDADVYLHFTRMAAGPLDGETTLDWMAHQGYWYGVYRMSSIDGGLPGTHIADVQAPSVGGIGLWAVVTATQTVAAGSATSRFYYVRVIGP